VFDPISERPSPFSLGENGMAVPLLWPGSLWIAASVDPQRLTTASLFRQPFPLRGNDAVSRLSAASCSNQKTEKAARMRGFLFSGCGGAQSTNIRAWGCDQAATGLSLINPPR